MRQFLEQTLGAMGVPLDVAIVDESDNIRVELTGEGGDQLLRRRAEALDALQHIVNTAFRRELKGDRVVRRRLPRLPQGQGRRDEADGALPDGAGEEHRRRSRRWGRSTRTRAAWFT